MSKLWEDSFSMKDETKEKILDVLSAIFISGDTYMVVAWAMFILGFIFGAIIF